MNTLALRRAVCAWGLLLTCANAFAPASVFGNDVIPSGALDEPIGARSNGMGQTGVADRTDPDNIYYNPANVTALDGVYSTASYRLLYPLIDTNMRFRHVGAGAGAAVTWGRPMHVAVNVAVGQLQWGRTIFTDSGGYPLGEFDYGDHYVAVTAGVATRLGDRADCAFGAAFKHWTGDFGPDEPSLSLADVGVVVSSAAVASDWSLHPSLGLALVDLGSDTDIPNYDVPGRAPSMFNYGASVRVDGPAVSLGSRRVSAVSTTLNIDGNHGLHGQNPQWGFGYEVSALQIASARWGRRINDHDRSHGNTWGVSLDVPAGPLHARFDYANIERVYSSFYYMDSIVLARDVFGVSLAWRFDGQE